MIVDIPDSKAAALVSYLIADVHAWDEWDMYRHGGKPVKVDGLGTVELVDAKTDYEYEYTSNPVWLVFKVTAADGTIRHYKKSATLDSYGDGGWHGQFAEVFPKTKTVTTYDYS